MVNIGFKFTNLKRMNVGLTMLQIALHSSRLLLNIIKIDDFKIVKNLKSFVDETSFGAPSEQPAVQHYSIYGELYANTVQ